MWIGTVSLERLTESLDVDPLQGEDPWGCGFYLALVDKVKRVNRTPFDPEDDAMWSRWTRTLHAERVRWFVDNPDAIDPILVQSVAVEGSPYATDIIDGWHRYHALLYMGVTEIEIEYKGRAEVLGYLKGY